MAENKQAGTTTRKQSSEACPTIDLGLDGFTECPRVGPNACRYALPFGYSFLCRHPDFGSAAKPDRQPARRRDLT